MQPSRRTLLASMGALASASFWLGDGFAQQSPARPGLPSADFMNTVNPELRGALAGLMQNMGSMADANAASLPSLRKMSAAWAQPLLPAPAVNRRLIPGPAGAPQVPVYVVNDSAGASRPALLHIHGGGYISGSAEIDRSRLQQLAVDHDCVVVTVEYRLAPETRFPGSLEDIYAALKWLHDNAESLGVDPHRIAIKGESAGGGHAAALAIAARDRGEVPLCLQLLIYPMLDDRTGSSNQLPPQFGHYMWTAGSNRFGWSSLLGVPAGSAQVPKGSVPARVTDLAGLAPAFIGVGSIDLFALEDIDYARRLLLAGVSTELNIVPGAFHGFDAIAPATNVSRNFTQAWNDALARAFKVA